MTVSLEYVGTLTGKKDIYQVKMVIDRTSHVLLEGEVGFVTQWLGTYRLKLK